MTDETPPYIVEAVAVSANAGSTTTAKSPLALLIEQAMAAAVQAAYDAGENDPVIIREKMQEARMKATTDYEERNLEG